MGSFIRYTRIPNFAPPSQLLPLLLLPIAVGGFYHRRWLRLYSSPPHLRRRLQLLPHSHKLGSQGVASRIVEVSCRREPARSLHGRESQSRHGFTVAPLFPSLLKTTSPLLFLILCLPWRFIGTSVKLCLASHQDLHSEAPPLRRHRPPCVVGHGVTQIQRLAAASSEPSAVCSTASVLPGHFWQRLTAAPGLPPSSGFMRRCCIAVGSRFVERKEWLMGR
ncbi:hypothetical protein AAHA92_02871 [Salvia divinorum]|uniref:Uncharacterized protein n=1 Tax=Salvia divinorum TaxID=28513 RepID=A0ABD1IJC7_SALDI